MQAIDRFALHVQTPTVVRAPPPIELRFDGVPVRAALPEGAIRAQFACRHGFLLLLCEPGFDGDSVHVVLLDPQLNVLDAVELGSAGVFGLEPRAATLGPARIVNDDEIEFDFRVRWRVRVLDRPTRAPQEFWNLNLFRKRGGIALRRYLWFARSRMH